VARYLVIRGEEAKLRVELGEGPTAGSSPRSLDA
jgi:hypothetical protein